MNDRFYMEEMLLVTKGFCDLLMHATIESATPDVHNTFNTNLFDTLAIQNAIYKQMEQKGWYKTQNVPVTKVQQAASTLQANN